MKIGYSIGHRSKCRIEAIHSDISAGFRYKVFISHSTIHSLTWDPVLESILHIKRSIVANYGNGYW